MHVRIAALGILRCPRGFSLAELLVVCAVLGLVMSGLLVIQQGGTNAYVVGSSRVAAQQNGRVALEMMVRELRSAQSVSAVSSSTDITFLNRNGVATQYQLASGTLNRIVAGASTPLIEGVTSLEFTCYSAFDNSLGSGTTTTTPASVQAVRIRLTTGSETAVASYADANQHATMESWVRLRNCLPSLPCV